MSDHMPPNDPSSSHGDPTAAPRSGPSPGTPPGSPGGWSHTGSVPPPGWGGQSASWSGQYSPYTAGPAAPPGLPPAERIRIAWQRRHETDYIFNYWSALGWTILTLGIYGFYVFYQLVRRMRDHNVRRLELLDASITFAWEQAGRRGLQEELSPSFQRASGHLWVMRQMTTEFRDPGIWLVIAIIARGIAELLAFIFLDQDLVKHDQAEVGIEYELALIFGRLGQPLSPPDQSRVKGQQNYVGRVLASVFSLGVYLFWWYYNMMEEPNRHFGLNWAQEDQLAAAVQSLYS